VSERGKSSARGKGAVKNPDQWLENYRDYQLFTALLQTARSIGAGSS
jgi:hypothetical protein